MSAYILLAAGMGRTMQTRGTKSLLEYDETVVLDHQVKTILSRDKRADISIVTGFEHDKVIQHTLAQNLKIRIIHNQLFKLTSQTESLKLAFNALLETDCYIIHGDMIFNTASLAVRKNSFVVVDNSVKEKRAVGISQRDNALLHMAYGLPTKWGQIVYIAKKDFSYAKDVLNSFKNNKMTFEYINMLDKIKFGIHSDGVKTLEINRGYESISNQQT